MKGPNRGREGSGIITVAKITQKFIKKFIFTFSFSRKYDFMLFNSQNMF